jgi:hypothetical protein
MLLQEVIFRAKHLAKKNMAIPNKWTALMGTSSIKQ